MRSFKLALIALLCVAGAAIAAPNQIMDPAHKNPGATKPAAKGGTDASECAACHICASPTHENPCLQSCRRHGAQFLGKHTTDEGPEIVIIDQLASLYGPVVFAHQLHAKMSSMTGGCTNCHHYSPATGKVPSCRECHAPTRETIDLRQPALKGAYHRQCINCHLDWGHENACGFCHVQATDKKVATGTPATGAHDPTDIVGTQHPLIKATPTYTYQTNEPSGAVVTFHHEDHVQQFGLNCVDCHKGDSCRSCHDTGTAKEKRRLDHVTTCGACHAERNCSFCHSAKAKPPFDHRVSTGWPLEPFHKRVACSTCHGEAEDFRKPDPKCTSCHIHWAVGSFDHAVTGIKLNDDHRELECSNCHLEMNFAATPSCSDCHDGAMLPGKLPGTKVPRR
jgi:hypothetical protein